MKFDLQSWFQLISRVVVLSLWIYPWLLLLLSDPVYGFVLYFEGFCLIRLYSSFLINSTVFLGSSLCLHSNLSSLPVACQFSRPCFCLRFWTDLCPVDLWFFFTKANIELIEKNNHPVGLDNTWNSSISHIAKIVLLNKIYHVNKIKTWLLLFVYTVGESHKSSGIWIYSMWRLNYTE